MPPTGPPAWLERKLASERSFRLPEKKGIRVGSARYAAGFYDHAEQGYHQRLRAERERQEKEAQERKEKAHFREYYQRLRAEQKKQDKEAQVLGGRRRHISASTTSVCEQSRRSRTRKR